MNRLTCLLLLYLFFSSCTSNQRQFDNEKNILGDWISVKTSNDPDDRGLSSNLPEFREPSFTFCKNHTYDNKVGFFKSEGKGTGLYELYLGTIAKYKISTDSISFYNLDSNRWDDYKLVKLNDAILQFEIGKRSVICKRLQIKKNRTPNFDKIILSTSGCFGWCPISSTIINSNGTVVFKGLGYTGKKGLYTGVISKEHYQQLQDNFRKFNFDSLKTRYATLITDQQTISVTFVKDGKIYKSVEDYGRIAPYLFKWAYTPLEYLYQTIPLKKVEKPNPLLNILIDSKLRLGNMVLDLNQSETFLLFDYLNNGKQTTVSFRPRFKLKPYFDINTFSDIDTDGRFFTFAPKGDSKPITIDIGFNFYDVNSKIWQWRKAVEYD
ncbi:MAG TPA: DUF6438 domain-containing protein [Mucilaginibacter sp.]|jgi:hypothetical protein